MRIQKGETKAFDNYDVTCLVRKVVLGIILPWRSRVTLTGVLEAEEETGRIVRQERTLAGMPVFTNGVEDIYIDNSAKLLMLMRPVREAFHASGFRPKVIITYEQGVRITNRDPSATLTVIEQRLEEIQPSG